MQATLKPWGIANTAGGLRQRWVAVFLPLLPPMSLSDRFSSDEKTKAKCESGDRNMAHPAVLSLVSRFAETD